MSAAEFIFKHFCRIRRRGLSPTSWAALLWLSTQGEVWSTRRQIMQALNWLKDDGTTSVQAVTNPLIEHGYIQRTNTGGRGVGMWSYRITPAGVAFLRLNDPSTINQEPSTCS